MNEATQMAATAGIRRVSSKDRSSIAFERFGSGPPVILVGGAFNDRNGRASGVPLAKLLAPHFTVYAYDRRGRGESGENLPYSVAREVEDLAALSEEAGGRTSLYGMSSGAALVIEAVASGLPVTKVALYEPPFSLSTDAQARAKAYDAELRRLAAAQRWDDAVALFMTAMGMPPEHVYGMRQAPIWPALRRLAPSLAHDSAVLNNQEGAPVPVARIGRISAPILVISGGASPPFLREAAEATTAAASHGFHRMLEGQTHDVSIDVLAPVLIGYFSSEDAA